jgi:hypothetical protein
MRSPVPFLTLALTLVLGATSPALAGDFCLDAGGVLYIGKAQAIPPTGKCKPWNGTSNACGGSQEITTGTICKASDGSHLNILITTACPVTVSHDHVVLPLPSMTGGTDTFFQPDMTGTGGSTSTFSAAKVPCSPPVVPIP